MRQLCAKINRECGCIVQGKSWNSRQIVDHAQVNAWGRSAEGGFGDGDNNKAFIMETLPALSSFGNVSAIARKIMRRPKPGANEPKRFTAKATPVLATVNEGECSCKAECQGKIAHNLSIIRNGTRGKF
jgi:hypothetical protein